MAIAFSGSTEPAQPVDHYITANGLRIHYVDWGTSGKQPLILLHGIGRVARTFDHVATHYNAGYHVIAVDMRGHGDSDWDPQGAYLVEDYVKDIEVLVQQLKLRNIVLWGYSTGGRVAQVFAGMHPELVSAVISEDVGPERPSKVTNRRAKNMSLEVNGWATMDELITHFKTLYPGTVDHVVRTYAEHGSKRQADGRFILKRDPRILEGFVPTDLWRFIRLIKAPIIYILGGRSDIVPPETQQEIRQTLPQAQIVTLPGLGHYPNTEDPEGFLAIVDRFLSGIKSVN